LPHLACLNPHILRPKGLASRRCHQSAYLQYASIFRLVYVDSSCAKCTNLFRDSYYETPTSTRGDKPKKAQTIPVS